MSPNSSPDLSPDLSKDSAPRTVRYAWYWLLLLPYLGLLFPQFYARTTPTLWGVPFFYWYQFSWVILSSIITGIVYLTTDSRRKTDSSAKAGMKAGAR